MDLLHSRGVELTVHLQAGYGRYEGAFRLASDVADLHTTFFWWFPVWFHLRRDSGLRLFWAAVIGDWLNVVLKWVLFGERPYWWVHETQFYGDGPRPSLQQFPITCETGPGSPSGHAMGIAGVWYVMVTSLLAIAAEKRCPPLLYKLLQVLLWGLMATIALVVCMSRVYMAAHFPHQVIAGIFTGGLVAVVVSQFKWIYNASMRRYLFTALFLASFTVGFYLLLGAAGVDLLWTMAKAQRRCVRPDWVHFNSTPFASLMRHTGSLVGVGLGLHSPLPGRRGAGAALRAASIITSLFLLQLLDRWTFSSEDHVTFYILTFGKNVVALLIPTTLVPAALCRVLQGNKENKNL